MSEKSMAGSMSIQDAARCVEEQSRGNMDHQRAHGKGDNARDMGDSDLAKVKKHGYMESEHYTDEAPRLKVRK